MKVSNGEPLAMKQAKLTDFITLRKSNKRRKKKRRYFILYPEEIIHEYRMANIEAALEKAGIDKKAWRRKIREHKKKWEEIKNRKKRKK